MTCTPARVCYTGYEYGKWPSCPVRRREMSSHKTATHSCTAPSLLMSGAGEVEVRLAIEAVGNAKQEGTSGGQCQMLSSGPGAQRKPRCQHGPRSPCQPDFPKSDAEGGSTSSRVSCSLQCDQVNMVSRPPGCRMVAQQPLPAYYRCYPPPPSVYLSTWFADQAPVVIIWQSGRSDQVEIRAFQTISLTITLETYEELFLLIINLVIEFTTTIGLVPTSCTSSLPSIRELRGSVQ